MLNDDNYKLLRLIESSPRISQREISKKCGLSLGKVNYCLKSLVKKGWIKIKRFSKSEHKIGYIYIMTPEGLKSKSLMTIDFLARKLSEYEALQVEITSLKDELKATSNNDKFLDPKLDKISTNNKL